MHSAKRFADSRWFLLLPLAVCLAGPTPTLGQEALTTNQLTALHPSEANRAARTDLLSVLRPAEPFDKGMFARLKGVAFETQPYGTKFLGLCARDTLWLKYAPIDTGPQLPD